MSLDYGKALGKTMRSLRAERLLSHEGLAERCHMTPASIRDLEAGKGSPSLAVLGEIAAAFGITLSSFVRLMEDRMEGRIEIADEKSFTPKKENDSTVVNGTL